MVDDPFALLGLERRFDLDPRDVRRAWLSRAAGAHPDAQDARGVGDDAEASLAAAALNRARRTLDDPERRADALLRLLGGPAAEQEKSLPPAFLMEVMEAREAFEEADAQGDTDRIAALRAWAVDERAAMIDDVAARFASLPSPPDASALREIRVCLNAWRYLERMLEQTADTL
jgi:molecular chaperone HscB